MNNRIKIIAGMIMNRVEYKLAADACTLLYDVRVHFLGPVWPGHLKGAGPTHTCVCGCVARVGGTLLARGGLAKRSLVGLCLLLCYVSCVWMSYVCIVFLVLGRVGYAAWAGDT